MGCRGCGKKRKAFRRLVMRHDKLSAQKQKNHFMKVCVHGVPHGFMCQSCNKIISIPEDAKIKAKPEDAKIKAKQEKPENK